MDIEAAFRTQASACRELGSPMYGELLDVLADDHAAGGSVRALLAGHEDEPGPSALGLRLLGSVHRLVLTGRAPELATFYPSAGGTYIPAAADAALLRLVEAEPDAVREWIDQPPQTNEVGRAAALYGGLLHVPWQLPLRLFEMGASGGLNLLADRFAYVTRDGVLGDPDSSVRLDPAWRHGPPDKPVQIVSREGADTAPVDVRSEEGRLTLLSYVWPDQTARLERLRHALELAAATDLEVRREDAVAFLEGIELADGAVTVLWHSVMLQYLAQEDRERVVARIEELGAAAAEDRPFAHLSLEPTRRTAEALHEFLVVLQTWPGPEARVLAKAAPHGLPLTWE